ncbi:exopolyphosphatase [Nematocida displodere]|uniref:inorganic diphosphatase n=1 Tax=Nematocida displodere TaxID=1805483 RepID=A0A177EIY1_9MICR|nr:exopolyphosphatase [Nematocida displodere]
MEYTQFKEVLAKSSFSQKLKSIYVTKLEEKSVSIVMGNPSCDQDSFIGSHVLGVVLNRVPVVNMSKKIFSCKKDLLKVLEVMDVSVEDLVFLEKHPEGWVFVRGGKTIKFSEKEITATLIDHNFPCTELLTQKNFTVDHIIDHHPILEASDMYNNVSGLCIDLNAGSCCSLIYNYIKTFLGSDMVDLSIEFGYLVLLIIPVVTDTSFLSKRTHKVDTIAVNELLEMTNIPKSSAEALYASLKKAKQCEDNIESDLILQMDYKAFDYPPSGKGKTFGMSSVKYGLDAWVQRDGKEKFLKTLQHFVEEKKHQFFLINSKTKGVREFFLFGNPGANFPSVTMYDGGAVNSRQINGDPELTVYSTDPLLSRKLIAPKIYQYLEKQ